MGNWMRGTIKTKLIVSFAILLVIPSLMVGFLSYGNAKNKVESQIMANSEGTLHFLSNSIDMLVGPKLDQMGYFADVLHAKGAGPTELEQSRKRLEQFQKLHADVALAYLGTEAGDFVMSPITKFPDGFDPRKRDWYKEAMANKGKAIISDPYEDAGTGIVVVSVVKALSDGSGVVGIDLSLDKFLEVAGSYSVGKHGFIYIVDKAGRVIAHPELKNGEEVKGSQYDPIFKQENGRFEYEEKGEVRQTLFETNQLTNWKLAGVIVNSEIEREVSSIFTTTMYVILLSMLVGFIMIVLILRSVMRPIHTLMEATEKISHGDLTERISIRTKDEIGQLGLRFNQMVDALAALIAGVRQTVDQLATSSEELTASAQQTGKAAEHIAESVQEVASSTETQVQSVVESEQSIGHVTTGMQQISHHAQNVATGAIHSSELAQQGSESLETAVSQMGKIHETISDVAHVIKGLGESSQEIGQIVEDITSIASQTNLLALNAAIEAARAGEAGRGFAVVADEVRKLAEQSSQSAAKITRMITTIQAETNQAVQSIDTGTKEVVTGMEVVSTAEESFQRIKTSVQEVASQIQEVSAASQQMSATTEQLLRSSQLIKAKSMETAAGAEGISSASEQQLASMEEISASAASLSILAEELQDMVRAFKLK